MYNEIDDFINQCKYGKLEVAKQVLEKYPNIHNSFRINSAFREASHYGQLHILQWLFSIQPNIDISAEDEIIFRGACCFGNLKIAQWLLNVKPSIDISASYNSAFQVACSYGHFNVAVWLLFQYTCRNNITQLLLSLKPNNIGIFISKSAINYLAKSFLLYCLYQKNISLFL